METVNNFGCPNLETPLCCEVWQELFCKSVGLNDLLELELPGCFAADEFGWSALVAILFLHLKNARVGLVAERCSSARDHGYGFVLTRFWLFVVRCVLS